jgi:hypothetical protein
MNNYFKRIVFIAFLIAGQSLVHAEQDFPYTMIYPINSKFPVGQWLYLSVVIPQEFKVMEGRGQDGFISASKAERVIFHRVDINDMKATMPEILMNLKNSCKYVMNKDSRKNFKILDESIQNCQNYSVGTLICSFTMDNSLASLASKWVWGQYKGIIWNQYFLGPTGCAGYEYLLMLPHDASEEEAVNKIKEYAKNNVSVVKL